MIYNTVLVTGGSGYIGSHFVWRLSGTEFFPIVFDVKSPSKTILKHAIYYRGDVRNYHALLDAFSRYKPKCVVHLAAITANTTDKHDEKRLWEVNVAGSENVLRAAFQIQRHNIVFTSSAAVYGEARPGIAETHALHPKNTYGITKKKTEESIKRYVMGTHGGAVILRLFNIAGNNPQVNLSHNAEARKTLISNALRVAEGKKKTLVIYGQHFSTADGTAVRDYVHIDDVVEAIYKATNYVLTKKDCVTVNIGSGIGATNLEVIRTVEQVIGHSIPIRFGRPRAHEIICSVANNRRALQVLGWQADRSDRRTIIKSTCNYYGLI